ncbi:MAG: hypothetical protein C4321_04235, partial [Chloroflexota bacterium]
ARNDGTTSASYTLRISTEATGGRAVTGLRDLLSGKTLPVSLVSGEYVATDTLTPRDDPASDGDTRVFEVLF